MIRPAVGAASVVAALALAVACSPSEPATSAPGADRGAPEAGAAGAVPAATAGADPGSGSPFDVADPDPAARDPDGGGYLVAESVVPLLAVWDQPDPGGAPRWELAHPTPSGAPLVLLVTEVADGWLRVLLPVRPNGSQGWVRTEDVSQRGHRWRIDVHLSAHELVVHHGDEVWMVEPIAIGQQPTPTPGGTFYLLELLQPPEPGGPYGPFAFGLSGFSEVLDSFAGGDGRLGLHGTDQPATLGSDVTNGCIRVHNEAITQLAAAVPLGTPLTIHA